MSGELRDRKTPPWVVTHLDYPLEYLRKLALQILEQPINPRTECSKSHLVGRRSVADELDRQQRRRAMAESR